MLGKAYTRSIRSLRSFPNTAFETVPMFVWLTMALVCPFKEDHLVFHASLLQAIDSVMSLALCLQTVSQASQHFRSSEKQATCESCFACQHICSVISLHSSMSKAVPPLEYNTTVLSLCREICLLASHLYKTFNTFYKTSTVFEGGCWPLTISTREE